MNRIDAPRLIEIWRDLEPFVRRTFLLTPVLLLLGRISFTDQAILDPDLGWHLKTGEWILAHEAVPQTDPFSQLGTNQPWVAYSWLFELILVAFERTFDLSGVVTLTLLMSGAIFAALFLLVRNANSQPAVIIGLLTLGLVAMSPMMRTPRPWLFSILFFAVELNLIQKARQNGQFRHLLWLPGLLLLWANLHIQFVYGLFLLGLLMLETLCFRYFLPTINALPVRRVLALVGVCFLVTLINPYSVGLYGALLEIIGQTGVYELVSEMRAMDFRGAADWTVLALTVGAAYVLGKNTRKDPFLVVVFVVGLFVAYRSRRDVWFLVIPSLYILAQQLMPTMVIKRGIFTRTQWQGALVMTLIFMATTGQSRNLNRDHLHTLMSEQFPQAAIRFIESGHFSGPLFNHYGWGGYLVWQLPTWRVSIDGRANLYGDARLRRSRKTWEGAPDWSKDPELAGAGLVIAPNEKPLTALLKCDQRFSQVYADPIATIFVAKPHLESQTTP